MKCNSTDVAIFQEARKTSVAAIIRDSTGDFMACRLQCYHGMLTAREAEAKTLLEAVQWDAFMELQHVIFETDCKDVVDAVESMEVDHSEFGSIVGACCFIIIQRTHIFCSVY